MNLSACDPLFVDIHGIHTITADILMQNATLQSIMANITYNAISQSASNIHAEFSVILEDATGDLSLTFSLCTTEEQTLSLLELVVEDSAADINSAVIIGLANQFGIDRDSITVAVSLSEFGQYFEFLVRIYTF